MTEWREVPGYEGMRVSDDGRIAGPRGLRKLRHHNDPMRYLHVMVGNPRRRLFVHHAVLLAFHGPRPDGQVARHLNGDAFDNRPVNLAWGTQQQNVADARTHGSLPVGGAKHAAKLTAEQALAIRASSAPGRVLAARYGISVTVANRIRRGVDWPHLVGA